MKSLDLDFLQLKKKKHIHTQHSLPLQTQPYYTHHTAEHFKTDISQRKQKKAFCAPPLPSFV